ncbi:hypothetical protein TNCV_4729271 [Trichonephila clavipes]|nr:hypothetical protein TNCV_4729271 [Trichonephila clavipes]
MEFSFGSALYGRSLLSEYPIMAQVRRRNAYQQVLELDRGWIVAYRESSKVHLELVLAAGLSVEREREIKNLGFYGRAAAHKPNITPQNAKHRFQWCRVHRHWTVDMWKTVLWIDQSRFKVWQSDGRVWVWKMPGKRFFSATALCRLLSLVVEA